jgi:hypothetical protein
MGFIVTCKDKEIWSPSLTTGNLYFEQITSAEKIIGEISGVTNPFDDELEIEEREFEKFINASLRFLQNTNNPALVAMLSGCLEVSLYLNFLITESWLEAPFELRFLNEKAKAMAGIA